MHVSRVHFNKCMSCSDCYLKEKRNICFQDLYFTDLSMVPTTLKEEKKQCYTLDKNVFCKKM